MESNNKFFLLCNNILFILFAFFYYFNVLCLQNVTKAVEIFLKMNYNNIQELYNLFNSCLLALMFRYIKTKKGIIYEKVTYQQVADALNISRVTVWKAVNDKPCIAPDTKRSILQKPLRWIPISIADSKNINVVTAPPKHPLRHQNCNVAVAIVSRPETSTF